MQNINSTQLNVQTLVEDVDFFEPLQHVPDNCREMVRQLDCSEMNNIENIPDSPAEIDFHYSAFVSSGPW